MNPTLFSVHLCWNSPSRACALPWTQTPFSTRLPWLTGSTCSFKQVNTGGLHPKNIQTQYKIYKAGFLSKVLTAERSMMIDEFDELMYASVCQCMLTIVNVLTGRWWQRWAAGWSPMEPNGAGLSLSASFSFFQLLSASFSLSSFCSGERLSLLEDHPSKLPQLVPSQPRAPQQCRRQWQRCIISWQIRTSTTTKHQTNLPPTSACERGNTWR